MGSYQFVADKNGNVLSDIVLKLPEGVFIPKDENNKYWAEYQKWLSDGNTPDPVPVENRRAYILNQLISIRDNEIKKNIIVNEKEFYADDASINLMHQCITIEGLGIDNIFPCDWILADGSVVQVTYEDMKTVASAISARKQACYSNYISLVSQINASQNPESIDINIGWPN